MRKIPFAKVVCDGNELDNVRSVLESGWLTTASRAEEFERKFREAVGAKYACAVNSCTSALHLALEAAGVTEGDKVVVPTWTFTASAEVVRYLGADPVIVDVDYGTGLMSPASLSAALETNTKVKAVVGVHYAGQPLALTLDNESGILEICRKHDVKLIEDAAHAFPSRWMGRPIGCWGDVTCFSFYANKTITTGEGGMLTTNDEAIFERAKTMRLHGINRDIWSRFTKNPSSWEYDVVAPGYKYNMPDLNAAIGLAQLERAALLRSARQTCGEYYLGRFKDVRSFDLPKITVPFEDHSWHLFPIVLNDRAKIERNTLIQKMADRGVGTSVHYKPLHRMTYYKEHYGLDASDFPSAERLWKGTLSLPIYPSLSRRDLAYIADTVLELIA